MRTSAQREMAGTSPRKVERVGIAEMLRIAIRQCQFQNDAVPFGNRDTSQFHGLIRSARERMNGTAMTKQFLDGSRDQFRLGMKTPELSGVLQ